MIENVNLLDNITNAMIKYALIGFVLILAVLLIKLLLKKRSRNNALLEKNEGNFSFKNSEIQLSRNPSGFIFGLYKNRYAYLPHDSEGHIGVFGGSGKGKTSAILIPTLRAWEGTFFAIDISGDINTKVPEADNGIPRIVFEPDNPECSVIYNVFASVDRSRDKEEAIKMLVNLIVPIPEKVNEVTEYYLKTARKIFLASMLAFYDEGYDFCEICKKVFYSSLAELFSEIEESGSAMAKGYIGSMKGENEKNVNGGKSELDGRIELFATNSRIAEILRRPFCFRDGLLTGKILGKLPEGCTSEQSLSPEDLESSHIFLVIPDKKQETYGALMNIVVAQILDYISGRDYDPRKDKRILLAIDEFASIGYLKIVAPARKFRKYGCNIAILTQSLADIDLIYSVNERKAILENFDYKVVLSANDPETQTYFSNLVGKVSVEKRSTTTSSHGSSTSVSTQDEYAVNPSKWENLGDNLVVIHNGFVLLKKNYYFKK